MGQYSDKEAALCSVTISILRCLAYFLMLDKYYGMCYHRHCVKRNDRDSTKEYPVYREKVHRLKGLPKETFVNSLLSSLCERNSSSAGREVPLQTLECRI